MNKLAIVTFMLGAAGGSVAGYFYASKKLNESYGQQLEDARKHYKAKYEAKLNEDLKDKITETIKEEPEKEVKKPDRKANIPNVQPEYTEIIQKTDYSKFSKVENESEIVIKDGPYPVSEEEYEDFLNIERYEMTYFKDDDVFMNSSETVWNEGLERIGDENLVKILNEGDDEAYIINEDYGEGYHLMISDGTYENYMIGRC